MKTLLSCEFNMDTGCVELRYSDSSMISINCTAVEDEVANSRFQRSELDWLIYNDPLSYAELILNADPEEYLRTVTNIPVATSSGCHFPLLEMTFPGVLLSPCTL